MSDTSALPPTRQQPEQYGAPRRFSIRTLLVVTAAFAAILSVLTWLGIPKLVVLHLAGFLAMIGLAQSLLFGGREPRQASIVSGILILTIYGAGMFLYLGTQRAFAAQQDLEILIAGAPIVLIFGAAAGYVGGALVGGLFLVMDRVERRMRRRADIALSQTGAGNDDESRLASSRDEAEPGD